MSGDKNKPGETSGKTTVPQKPLFVLSACPPHNLKRDDYTWIPLAWGIHLYWKLQKTREQELMLVESKKKN